MVGALRVPAGVTYLSGPWLAIGSAATSGASPAPLAATAWATAWAKGGAALAEYSVGALVGRPEAPSIGAPPAPSAASRRIETDKPATAATSVAANAALQTRLRPRCVRCGTAAASSAALTRTAKPLRAVATGSERMAAPIKA